MNPEGRRSAGFWVCLMVNVGCTDVGCGRKSEVKCEPHVFALEHIGEW